MAIKVQGVDELFLALKQVGPRAERRVAAKMLKGAEEIAKLAVAYAPVDEGNLESAIKVAEDRSGVNGRRVVAVYVDPNVAAAGTNNTVGNYAMRMHEGEYKLGPKSRQKAASTGKRVGRKYLARAFKELSDKVFTNMVSTTRRLMRSRSLFSSVDLPDEDEQ